MAETAAEADLRLACEQPGCPLCRLFAMSAGRALESWAYEGAADPSFLLEVQDSGGFCVSHTEMLIARGEALPLARLAQLLVETERQYLAAPGRRAALARPALLASSWLDIAPQLSLPLPTILNRHSSSPSPDHRASALIISTRFSCSVGRQRGSG